MKTMHDDYYTPLGLEMSFLLILFTASIDMKRRENEERKKSHHVYKKYYFESIYKRASCLHGRER